MKESKAMEARSILRKTLALMEAPYPPKPLLMFRFKYEREKARVNAKKEIAAHLLRNRIAAIDKKLGIKTCPDCHGRGEIPAPSNHGYPGQLDYHCFTCNGTGAVKTKRRIKK